MIEQISGNTGRFVVYAIVTLSILLLSLMIYYLINIGNRFKAYYKNIYSYSHIVFGNYNF